MYQVRFILVEFILPPSFSVKFHRRTKNIRSTIRLFQEICVQKCLFRNRGVSKSDKNISCKKFCSRIGKLIQIKPKSVFHLSYLMLAGSIDDHFKFFLMITVLDFNEKINSVKYSMNRSQKAFFFSAICYTFLRIVFVIRMHLNSFPF